MTIFFYKNNLVIFYITRIINIKGSKTRLATNTRARLRPRDIKKLILKIEKFIDIEKFIIISHKY